MGWRKIYKELLILLAIVAFFAFLLEGGSLFHDEGSVEELCSDACTHCYRTGSPTGHSECETNPICYDDCIANPELFFASP